jgi:hypothetical protein
LLPLGNEAKFSESAMEDVDDLTTSAKRTGSIDETFIEEAGNQSDKHSIIASVFPLNGRPFSAVNRELLPKYFEQAEELWVFTGPSLTQFYLPLSLLPCILLQIR